MGKRLRTDIVSISVSTQVASAAVNAAMVETTKSAAKLEAAIGQAEESFKRTANPTSGKAQKQITEESQPTVKDSSVWREFEFVEGSSSKFWKVCVKGNDVIVKFGRIGTEGQEKTNSFSDAVAANKYAADITTEKICKGYVQKTLQAFCNI